MATVTDRPKRPRRGWVAFLLSLLCQGLGHLYAGAPLRAVAALALVAILAPLVAIVRALLDFSLAAVLVGVLFAIVATLIIPVDAAFTARRRRDAPLTRWNRLWIYALYVIAFAMLVPPVLRWELNHSWFRLFKVPSGGMMDTLLVGDHITADMRRGKLLPVRRGDIVVFRFPPEPEVLFIKRVVGLPGETLELRDGVLIIDGEPIDEPYVAAAYRASFGAVPVTVPDGEYYVLGDHRNASSDSRRWGTVPEDHLLGRVRSIWWSYDDGSLMMDEGPVDRLKHWAGTPVRAVTRARWDRIGRRLERAEPRSR